MKLAALSLSILLVLLACEAAWMRSPPVDGAAADTVLGACVPDLPLACLMGP